jgi:predicted acyl esterase
VINSVALFSEKSNGIHIDWDVPIVMSDGVTLRCDVFRPDAPGQYPVIMALGPYGKWLSFQDEVWGGQWKMLCAQEPEILKLSSNRFQNYEFADPERFVPDGYVLIRVDVRGTGRSPGVMDLLSRRETQDYYECIEWAAVQPWCNQKVGLNGVSYLAMNQWQVSALRPPHLSAMCIWEGCSDFYREFYRHGGIHSLFGDLWYNKYVLPVQHGLGQRGWKSHINGHWVSGDAELSDLELQANRKDWRTFTRENPLATDLYWLEREVDFKRIQAPLLSSANWGGQGLHLRGNVNGFLKASSKDKWLNFHCLEHWTEFYTSRGIALQKKFFGHFLKGEDTGWGHEPKVMIQVRHPEKAVSLRSEASWPPRSSRYHRLYLEPSTSRLTQAQVTSSQAVSYDSTGGGLTFLTEPMTEERTILGHPWTKLWVSSSTTDADLFLIVRVFAPDLREITFSGANDPHTPVAHGWLRMSSRRLKDTLSNSNSDVADLIPDYTNSHFEPLNPNEIYEVSVEIWPTCIVVPKGYRIGLSIRGNDYVYPGDLSAVTGKIGQPATGVGPFRHDDLEDRPKTVFDNCVTLHSSAERLAYIDIPFV